MASVFDQHKKKRKCNYDYNYNYNYNRGRKGKLATLKYAILLPEVIKSLALKLPYCKIIKELCTLFYNFYLHSPYILYGRAGI